MLACCVRRCVACQNSFSDFGGREPASRKHESPRRAKSITRPPAPCRALSRQLLAFMENTFKLKNVKKAVAIPPAYMGREKLFAEQTLNSMVDKCVGRRRLILAAAPSLLPAVRSLL